LYIYNIIVFRRIKGIQGLTREIIIGLTTNIESQELRRCEYQSRDLVPEHPRASSTDDVEGLVGMLHDMFGPVFDHKTLLDQMPKVFKVHNYMQNLAYIIMIVHCVVYLVNLKLVNCLL
jgi:hypothetical protein